MEENTIVIPPDYPVTLRITLPVSAMQKMEQMMLKAEGKPDYSDFIQGLIEASCDLRALAYA